MISKVNDNAHCIQMNQLHTTVSVINAKYIKIVKQAKLILLSEESYISMVENTEKQREKHIMIIYLYIHTE